MKCPICNSSDVERIEKRYVNEKLIERDYDCLDCLTIYTTKEYVEWKSIPRIVRETAYIRVCDAILSKEELQEANLKGIRTDNVKARIRNGWSKEKALNTPTYKYKRYIRKARENDILPQTFYKRVKLGWDLETAATKKPRKKVR
ncbi:hypothetical protein [Paraliobacillus ryukyuensis]|uniref:hypothetical protein n=1 Tax=Paraliobacillus ryukyuensis TaxID=200904 RepID=UPI0009A6C294|nr:hypothetical protein [Paraliobacillus ryukyuensis]